MSFLGSILGSLFGEDSDDKGCNWYCDECDTYMNSQPGFTTSSGEWTCTECGCVNDVSENNIFYDSYDARDPYEEDNKDFDSYDEDDEGDDDDDSSERLSVWDAAAIWRSHGKDEDYMFGYSEEELEDA